MATGKMQGTDTIDALLDELPRDQPEQATAQVERALQMAAARPDRSVAADRAVTNLLAGRHTGDYLLPHLQLATLADLGRRCLQRLMAARPAAGVPATELRQDAWRLLDVVRRSGIMRRIAEANAVAEWSDRILALVDASHLTFGHLLHQRCEAYGARPLFRLPDGRRSSGQSQSISWHQVAGRVDLIARGLHAVTGSPAAGSPAAGSPAAGSPAAGSPAAGGLAGAPLALLCENRLEMALVDLACLSSGLVNVVIPASASAGDVAYILRHCSAATVLVSTGEQLDKVVRARADLPQLQTIIALEHDAASRRGVLPLEAVLERATKFSPAQLAAARDAVRIDDLATIMYTSGTTGTPKGIMFSHRNIVFKRFARALALPEIGEDDTFLCYLPLFHTFGRFLEMCGCIFWGATYCFAESPAVEALSQQMRELEPSAFISIPMKWMQLYEQIRRRVDLETAGDEEILAATRQVTGRRLRWGLSAAGYLDPEVFRFFQRQGIELMSGFGMTEATGGITMTPPGQYRDDSLGRVLPGIEVALADDGELKIRGPYVMIGHLDPPAGEPSFDDDGWFHTGDLMRADADGFLRIVDRKKEIYKNVKGQTVAPQKIENLFREFESVGRIFLVGDHRTYNTALIYPNPEVDLSNLGQDELQAHFRSLVVSANAFLAPFERIVDFAIIDRDFAADRQELTPKGTFRRQVIERSFASTIALLYRRTTVQVGGVEVELPNWLFQVLGVTAQDLQAEGDRLHLVSMATWLDVRRLEPGQVRIGSAVYRIDCESIDLGLLLTTPRLWIGNDELMTFAPSERGHRLSRRTAEGIWWVRSVTAYEPGEEERSALQSLLAQQDIDLLGLHRVALLLRASEPADAILAIRVLDHALTFSEGPRRETVLHLLRRGADCQAPDVVRRAFQVLLPVEHAQRIPRTLTTFLDLPLDLLDGETIAVLVERDLSDECLGALIAEAERRCQEPWPQPRRTTDTACSLLHLLADYGAAHPTRYRRIRAVLNRIAMARPAEEIGTELARARDRLQTGFRAWIGPPSRIAVDPETGLEYRWEDVIGFADEVDDEARRRLLGAFKNTSMLREGVFLFSGSSSIRLEDILPSGVWIRLLGEGHGKSVYRVAVRTRHHHQFDLVVNLNRTLPAAEVAQEIDWLAICSEAGERPPLVETFGGYWPEYDLWSEELIPGETLDHALHRLSRNQRDQERLQFLWPFAAWSAMSAFVDLWDRAGEANPSPGNVIVPLHDYHRGSRLVSLSGRQRYATVTDLLQALWDDFVIPVEQAHPQLAGLVDREITCAAVLDTVGPERGLRLLRAAVELLAGANDGELARIIRSFVEEVERHGFVPRRLHFAAERYRRWARLNPDATLQARAATLQEVEATYNLQELQPTYPEVRARFFRDTVFTTAEEPLAEALDRLVSQLRSGEVAVDELSSAVADLRAQLRLGADDDFFLARLSYPYLQPEDDAGYVAAQAASGNQQSEMVVTLADANGDPYRIRHVLSAKEVARLHRLFLAAKIPVQLRPEHRFLVAINERDLLIGGLFYEVLPEEQTAHLDKIVVAASFRGRGVAGALLEELCNRLRTAGLQWLTTGFFRPQFFYRYGFTVERRYAGLVRALVVETPAEGSNGNDLAAEPTRPVRSPVRAASSSLGVAGP